jgi:DNA-binding YbaB/EbfC family protein
MTTFFDFIKQAHLFQERWTQLQQEAAKKTVEASAGGGMITVVANGRLEILSIKIDPELVKLKDIAMLQDLIVAAVNEARRRAQEIMAEEIKGLTGGLSISGLFP